MPRPGSSSAGVSRGSPSSHSRSALAPGTSRPHHPFAEGLVGDRSRRRGERAVDGEDLLGHPAAVGLPVGRLPRYRDRDAVERGARRPPASPTRRQAAHPIGRACASGTACRRAPARAAGWWSTVIRASICAQSGCMLGMTPSSANLARSASSTNCTWAMTGLRSRGPFHSAAYSIASRRLAHRGVTDGVGCGSADPGRRSDAPPRTGCRPPTPSCRGRATRTIGREQSAPVSFSTTPSAKT
jgi:hypothetical protein